MAELHFNFLNHIIKVIEGELSEDVKQSTIIQLKGIITKDKDSIKLKSGSKSMLPGEVRN